MVETRLSLIRRLRDLNDAESWREFDELYRPLLFAYVRSKKVIEPEAEEDIVQDIFVRLTKALPKFELDHCRGRFRTWLWTVTQSAIAQWQRKQCRDDRAIEAWLDQSGRSDEAMPDEADPDWVRCHRERVLHFALARVRPAVEPQAWECFQRHKMKGLPAAEVAKQLGITRSLVYVNAHRVLEVVRQLCGDYDEDLDEPWEGPEA